jgi:hypothetical protein
MSCIRANVDAGVLMVFSLIFLTRSFMSTVTAQDFSCRFERRELLQALQRVEPILQVFDGWVLGLNAERLRAVFNDA